MTLPSTGPISLGDIQTEFGGSPPTNISEYYRNGSYVTANNIYIPTSGQVSFSNFYNGRKAIYVTLDWIVVGGGGAGGTGANDADGGGGAGGGGGGVSYGSTVVDKAVTSVSLYVGNGGTPTGYMVATWGNSGESSLITGSISAFSYGGGGGYWATGKWQSGSAGAGGNGGGPNGSAGGGYSSPGGSNGVGAGGGGGARDDGPGGAGGNGYYWPHNGAYYGGGGGGGGDAGSGGAGGAGGGGSNNGWGANGLGGGGAGGNEWSTAGGGGSGTVIISYVSATQLFTGGSVSFNGSRWFHTFTSPGWSSFSPL